MVAIRDTSANERETRADILFVLGMNVIRVAKIDGDRATGAR